MVALLRGRHIVTHNTGQHPEDSDDDGKKEEDGLEGVGRNEGFDGLHLRVEIPGDTLDGGLRIFVGRFSSGRIFHSGKDAC